jgi:hypothetical protein
LLIAFCRPADTIPREVVRLNVQPVYRVVGVLDKNLHQEIWLETNVMHPPAQPIKAAEFREQGLVGPRGLSRRLYKPWDTSVDGTEARNVPKNFKITS